MKKPFIVGVAGGPSSGKTAVCKKIIESLGDGLEKSVAVISQDCFYRSLANADEFIKKCVEKDEYNYEHPNAFDFKLMESVLMKLKGRNTARIPVYDMRKRTIRENEWKIIDHENVDVILVEGTLLLFSKKIQSLLDLRIFVDIDSDVRLSNRVVRDVEVFGRPMEKVLQEYVRFVKPTFEEFVMPTKKQADIILPRADQNNVAVELIVQHIKDWITGKIVSSRPKTSIVSDMLYSSTLHSFDADIRSNEDYAMSDSETNVGAFQAIMS